MIKIRKGSWSLACATLVLGFMLAVQLRTTADTRADLSAQRAEDVAARLIETEKERDQLKQEVRELKSASGGAEAGDEVRMQIGRAHV